MGIFRYLKYLKLMALFKDVVKAYKEETGEGKAPAILHRRVYGGIIVLIGTGIGIYAGVDLSATFPEMIDSVEKVVAAVTVLYGAIGVIIGAIKAKRKEK